MECSWSETSNQWLLKMSLTRKPTLKIHGIIHNLHFSIEISLGGNNCDMWFCLKNNTEYKNTKWNILIIKCKGLTMCACSRSLPHQECCLPRQTHNNYTLMMTFYSIYLVVELVSIDQFVYQTFWSIVDNVDCSL